MAQSGETHAFPQRLHHATPGWVRPGATFHIRLRVAAENPSPLTQPPVASALLAAARDYHERSRWHCRVFLVMSDHAHALIAFPRDEAMSRVIGEWKRYIARTHRVVWQVNFFDYRLRHDHELTETADYIRRNPVVKSLCTTPAEWPWVWSPP